MFDFIPRTFAQTATRVATQEAEQTNAFVEAFQALWSFVPKWGIAIIVTAIFFIIGKIIANKVSNYLTRQQEEYATLEPHKGVIILAERMTFLLVFAFGLIVALTVSGLMGDLGWLLGSIGVAIGFAMQGFLANFVSGIFLLAQERTKIGNFVEMHGENDLKGIIKEIGMRATILQTFSGLEIMVPNREFFEKPVTIYTSSPYRRLEIPIGVDYGTDLQKAIEVVMGVIDQQPELLKDHPKDVLVMEFADSSINLEARFWVPSKSAWWKIQSNVVHQVKNAFDANGIVIPFPHRTLKIDAHDPHIEGTLGKFMKKVEDL